MSAETSNNKQQEDAGMNEEVAELRGQFQQHCKVAGENFAVLYDKVNRQDTTLTGIDQTVKNIEQGMKPIRDLGAFFRVVKWIAAALSAGGVVVGAIFFVVSFFQQTPVQ